MPLTTFFFDLDDTLYPASSGVWGEIRQRIHLYLSDRLGFAKGEIEVMREDYFRRYGTTLRGLQLNHQVDTDDYLAFVHNIPLERYLHPDPELRPALQGIQGRKWIFTNADRAHAERVLHTLDLSGCFEGIIDVHVMAPYCKPMPEAFMKAIEISGNPRPAACVMIDDQPRVTLTAHSLGFHTILVRGDGSEPTADVTIRSLKELPQALVGM